MAFIAIDAKADVTESKKGKLTPAQHAQLNAWCLSKKTGILDCLNKCTATVQSISNNQATLVFSSGYIVICGRLIECEAGTSVVITTPTSGTTNGKIILRFSLSSTGKNEFVVTTKTGSLTQQDLNENPTNGVYEFELYSYTATSTNVTLTRTGEYVSDIGGLVDKIETEIENNIIGEGKPLYGYDTSAGTVEDRLDTLSSRLDTLGFKSATTQILNTTYLTGVRAFQQGKVVAVQLTVPVSTTTPSSKTKIGTISDIDLSQLPSEKVIYRHKVTTLYDYHQYKEITLSFKGFLYCQNTSTKDDLPELSGKYMGYLGPYEQMMVIG